MGLKNLDLGPIYSKNLTNDATIWTSNKNYCEMQTVEKNERDNNKY